MELKAIFNEAIQNDFHKKYDPASKRNKYALICMTASHR